MLWSLWASCPQNCLLLLSPYFDTETDRRTDPTTLLDRLSAPFCLPVSQHYPYSCVLLIAVHPAVKRDYLQKLWGAGALVMMRCFLGFFPHHLKKMVLYFNMEIWTQSFYLTGKSIYASEYCWPIQICLWGQWQHFWIKLCSSCSLISIYIVGIDILWLPVDVLNVVL